MECKPARFLLIVILAVLANQVEAAGFSFEKHWTRPIPLQGPPPDGFSDLEASLDPEDCGQCHETQYRDWSESRHSLSMGAGIVGQLKEPWIDKETAESCLDCHAPLSEQRVSRISENGQIVPNKYQIKKLMGKGLVCAACHVRRHKRYGPISRKPKMDDPPHGGFVEVKSFGASEFCKPCHQFEPFGNRVEGKLLEDTYNQWKNSRYAKIGVRCADCHMEERRHLWKGIHNKEMVAKGVKIVANKIGRKIKITIANTGVGHYFPTYVTPQVVVEGIVSLDGKETVVVKEAVGWYIELDLSGERYDTRIPPGKQWETVASIPQNAKEGKYKVRITVYPDEFYNRFYNALLKNPPEGVDTGLIKKAYRQTNESPFILFEKSWPLSGEKLSPGGGK